MKTNESVYLAAVGDVMLGDCPLMCGFGVRSSIENGNEDIFIDVKKEFKNNDIVIANLETVLSDIGRIDRNFKSVQMRGAKYFSEIIADAGFTVMSVANNHIMQHGDKAFDETISNLNLSGVCSVGISKDNKCVPLYKMINGIKFCFLAYSLKKERFSYSPLYAYCEDVNIIIDHVSESKRKCDHVILSIHWGEEYIDIPSSTQIELAHRMIDSGLSVLIGHHSHVIQGVERYNNGIVAYSLGNFVFDIKRKAVRKSMILKIKFTKNQVDDYRIIYAFIDNFFTPRIIFSTNFDYPKSIYKFGVISRNKISKKSDNIIYNIILFYFEFINSLYHKCYFLFNFFKYEEWVRKQNLSRFFLDKVHIFKKISKSP